MRPTHGGFRRTQWSIAALFCLLGLQYASWASRLPALKARFDLSPAEVGLLLTACGMGLVASLPVVPPVLRRIGARRLATVSALCLIGVLVVLPILPGYPAALAVIGVDGLAAGCLNVAMNTQGAALEARYGRTTMARLHATFSGGALCGAVIASLVTAATQALAVHFGGAAAILLVLLGFSRGGLPADDPRPQPTERSRRRLALPAGATLWLAGAMLLGTVVEGAMNDWSALYLKEVVKAASAQTPLGIAVVSGTMVVARLFADGWRTRWGDPRVVRVGCALATAGLLVVLAAAGIVPTLAGFAAVGLGMAAVTPCVYVAAAGHGPNAMTLVASMGSTGLLAGPAAIGFVVNAGGLRWGMGAVAVAALAVSLFVLRIRWPTRAEPRLSLPEAD